MMKKLLFLSVCFLLFFAAKSNAQISSYPYSNMPGGANGGGISIGYGGAGNMETDEVYPVDVSGLTLLGTQLMVIAHGDVSGDFTICNFYTSGGISIYSWDIVAFQAMYPNDNFTVEYIWEADYTDGTNTYIYGSDDTWGSL